MCGWNSWMKTPKRKRQPFGRLLNVMGNWNATSNQLKVANSTQNNTKTSTNKSLVEDFLKLNHKTLWELNTKDINECHCTNIVWRMSKINTTRVVPKRAKICYFRHLFSTCIASLMTSILLHLVGFSRSYSILAIPWK